MAANRFANIVVQFLVPFLCCLPAAADSDLQKDAKVGVILPLSGRLALSGYSWKNGLIMGFEDGQKEESFKVDLIFEDSCGEPKNGAAAAVKLLQVDQVELIIASFTHIVQALKSAVANAKKPLIYISVVKSIAAENPLFFRDFWDFEEASRAEASIAKNAGKRRVAYIREDGEACEVGEQAFLDEAKKQDLEIVFREEFPTGTNDVKLALIKAKHKRPEAIVFCAWKDAGLVTRKMEELGMLDIPSIHIEAPFGEDGDTPEVRRLYEKNGTISTWYGFIEGSMSSTQKELAERYKARFSDKLLPDFFYAYDLGRALTRIFKTCFKGGLLAQSCFSEQMESQDFQFSSGSFSFGKDRTSTRPILVMRVKDGVWVEAK